MPHRRLNLYFVFLGCEHNTGLSVYKMVFLEMILTQKVSHLPRKPFDYLPIRAGLAVAIFELEQKKNFDFCWSILRNGDKKQSISLNTFQCNHVLVFWNSPKSQAICIRKFSWPKHTNAQVQQCKSNIFNFEFLQSLMQQGLFDTVINLKICKGYSIMTSHILKGWQLVVL